MLLPETTSEDYVTRNGLATETCNEEEDDVLFGMVRSRTAPGRLCFAAEIESNGEEAFAPTIDERPSSAPGDIGRDREEEEDMNAGEVVLQIAQAADELNLERATAGIVELFRAGYQEEALESAVAFSHMASENLGRLHPTYINALATVAALVDQMGGTDEADMLLLEAETLHEELEVEVVKAVDAASMQETELEATKENFDHERDELVVGQSQSLQEGAGIAEALNVNADSKENVDNDDSEHGYSSDDSCGGRSSDGQDADIDVDPHVLGGKGHDSSSGSEGRPRRGGGVDSEDEDEEEAEAEVVTRLTWEVNALIRDGKPDEAARLLSEAEKVLLADGRTSLASVSQAALHTLWAAVLNDVGEGDKARDLYDEALRCLNQEIGLHPDSGNSTSGGEDALEEDDEDDEDQNDIERQRLESQKHEEQSANVGLPCPDLASPSPSQPRELTLSQFAPSTQSWGEGKLEKVETNSRELPAETKTTSSPTTSSPSVTEAAAELPIKKETDSKSIVPPEHPVVSRSGDIPLSSDQGMASHDVKAETPASPKKPSAPPPSRGSARHTRLGNAAQPGSIVDAVGPPPKSAVKNAPSSCDADPATATQKAVPGSKNDSVASTSKSAVPHASPAQQTAVPKTARVGGGFVGSVAPQPPKSAPKAKRRPKAKAKAVAEAPQTLQEEETLEVTPQELTPAEKESAEISQSLIVADHFLGLMKFERAADLLEEKLVDLSKESNPHHRTDLHVDVLLKYGGVLWWDGDPEGAIDAFTAGDEILEDRSSDQTSLKRRRADIGAQIAQVYRSCGDLDAADEHLSDVVKSLRELSSSGGETNAQSATGDGQNVEATPDIPLDDALKEALAALGQVCVQKKEYERAQELYFEAFSQLASEPAVTASIDCGYPPELVASADCGATAVSVGC